MLGKLLKYDFKWVYKVVGIFYVLALIFSVIGRGLGQIENSAVFSVLSKIFNGIAISMVVSSLINCLMRLWARIVVNMYKDESYLTHTLPVSKKTIYDSKVITAIITIFTTTIIGLICVFICYYSQSNIEFLKSALELAASTYDTTVVNLVLLISLVIFLEIMAIVFVGYLGIILGHKSNKSKMLKSIVFGFSIYMITQVFNLVALFIYGLFNPEIMNLINTTTSIDINSIKSIMYFVIVVYSIYSVVLYAVGKKQLEKGVNVE